MVQIQMAVVVVDLQNRTIKKGHYFLLNVVGLALKHWI